MRKFKLISLYKLALLSNLKSLELKSNLSKQILSIILIAGFTCINHLHAELICPVIPSYYEVAPGECEVFIDVPSPTTPDPIWLINVVNDFNNGPNASGIYPMGTTRVTFTGYFTDGTSKECFIDIRVIDDEQPVLECPIFDFETCIPEEENLFASLADFIAAGGSASDNCDLDEESFDVTVSTEILNEPCEIRKTWRFRILDVAGNLSAACELSAEFNDTENPVISYVPNFEDVACGADLPALVADSIMVTDNCPAELTITTEMDPVIDFVCADTEITYTWIVEDACGNSTMTSTNFMVLASTVPARLVGNPESLDDIPCNGDFPKIESFPAKHCTPATVQFDIVATADICNGYPVVYRWTPMDMCGNPGTVVEEEFMVMPDLIGPMIDEPSALEDINCSEGFPAQEVLTAFDTCIEDTENPTLDLSCDPIVLCTSDDPTQTTVFLRQSVHDNCSRAQHITYNYSINLDNDLTIDSIGSGRGNAIIVEADFPVGTHSITYSFMDASGNPVSCVQNFEIRNCANPPVAECRSTASVSLNFVDTNGDGINDTYGVYVFASQLNLGSNDPAGGPITLSLSPDPNDVSIFWDCNNIEWNELSVWVTNSSGEQSFCVVEVLVLDPQGACAGFNLGDRPGNPYACSAPMDVVPSIDPFTEDICAGYTVVYRWTSEDPCGNVSEKTESFDIMPSKPEITAPVDVVYELEALDECELEVVLEPAVPTVGLCSPIVDIITNYPTGALATNGGTVTLDAGVHEIEYVATDECGNQCSVISKVSILRSCNLACREQVNVSIGPECTAVITPKMVGIDIPFSCEFYYEVEIKDEHGHVIPLDMVDESHVGQNITVSITDPFCGTTCWGYARVENKLLSSLECDCPVGGITGIGETELDYAENCLLKCGHKDIIQSGIEKEYENLYCQYLPFAVPFDNCGNTQNIGFSDLWVESGCGTWKLQRTYLLRQNIKDEITGQTYPRVVDQCTYEYFVTSYSVNDTVEICSINEIPRIEDVDASYEDKIYLPLKLVHLSCGDLNTPEAIRAMYDDSETKDFENTSAVDEFNEGIPYAYPYYFTKGEDCNYHPTQLGENLCNVNLRYNDSEVYHCGTECDEIVKVFREWRLMDWCTAELTFWTQIIKQIDSEKPQIQAKDITIGIDPWTCKANALIPPPISLSDNCDKNLEYDVISEDFFKITGDAVNGYRVEGVPETYDGNPHILHYTSEDCCGNYTSVPFRVYAYDNAPPIPICEQFKVVSIPSTGAVEVGAHAFDSGSSDCHLSSFYVRRMVNNCDCDIPKFDVMFHLGEYNDDEGRTHYYYLSKHKKLNFVASSHAIAQGGYIVNFDDEGEEAFVRDAVNNFIPGEAYYNSEDYEDLDGEYRYVLEIEDPCGWSDVVHFCCEDVDQGEIMVALQVTDYYGNTNTCMARVEVQDKVAPDLFCPKDYTVYCEDNHNLTELSVEFGSPSSSNNCSEFSIDETVSEDINNCGEGLITRTFEIEHSTGTEICVQEIHVKRKGDYNFDNVIWPENFESENVCDISNLSPDSLDAPYNRPYYQSYLNCELIGDNYDDKLVEGGFGTAACAKIIRTWTLINWCDRRANGDYGMIRYEQVIKTSNSLDPEITGACEDIFVCVENLNCAPDSILLTNTGIDDCTPEEQLRWEFNIDLFSDGVINIVGNGNEYKNLFHFGAHIIHWKLIDNCGNETVCSQNFEIRNCKAPTPVCINGLAIDLIPMDTLDANGDPGQDGIPDAEMSEIWAKDFDASSAGVCGNGITFSFSQDTTDKFIIFDCDDIGINTIQLWVTDVRSGAQDFCETFIDVQDNNEVEICENTGTATVASISGKIRTEEDEIIENVEILLSGDANITYATDQDGSYVFPNMSLGGSYVVDPLKDIDHLNGVSTLDIVLIQKHILGLQNLTSPYKMIAADINNDASVSSIDLIELRKLILGIYPDFPNNESWQFVYADYEFIDMTNPWTTDPLYAYDIPSFLNDMNIDFIGMKTGDVNNSVSLVHGQNGAQNRNSEKLQLMYREGINEVEGLTTLEFYAKDFIGVEGLQFSLDYNPNEILIEEITSHALVFDESHYLIDNDKGMLNFSWNSETGSNTDLLDTDLMFSIVVSDRNATNKNYYFHVAAFGINPEAYVKGDVYDLEIRFDEALNNEFVLYQNKPNPWTERTIISFYLPAEGELVMNLYDHTGQLLKQNVNYYHSGFHEVVLMNSEINSNGIIICELIYDNQIISNKMLLIE